MRYLQLNLVIFFTLQYVVTAQYISVKNNDWKKDFKLIKSDEFAICPDNEMIMLQGLQIRDIPNSIIRSEVITNLDLSGNKLTEIRTGSFDTATELLCLNLSRNNIPIEKAVLFGHKTLKGLDLTGQIKRESAIELEDVDDDNKILYCNPSYNFPELEYLDLSETKFSYIDHNFSSCFPSLTHLYLNNRVIGNLTADFFDRIPDSLKSLHLRGNNIDTLFFPNIRSIEGLFLDSNPLNDFGHTVTSNSLKLLTLSNCTLRKFESELFTTLPNLLILDLSRNQLQDDSDFTGHNFLEVLSLSHNYFQDIPQLDNFHALDKLSLSYNRIVNVRQPIMSPTLTLLGLRGNQIQTIFPNVFAYCRSLEILDLSSNWLKLLPYESMQGLNNLRSLDLRDNRFKTIANMFGDGSITLLPSLSKIFIKSDSLDPIPVNEFNDLPLNCTIHVG